jgi:hypothetical protein
VSDIAGWIQVTGNIEHSAFTEYPTIRIRLEI